MSAWLKIPRGVTSSLGHAAVHVVYCWFWFIRKILGGTNMLTEKVIEKLSSYYSKAIRDHTNGTITYMQHAIWASFYHLSATNQEPHHQFSLKGDNSWCFFNRASSKQLRASAKGHDDMNLYLASIPREKLQYIKNVYKYLANRDMLKRCLKGTSQKSKRVSRLQGV